MRKLIMFGLMAAATAPAALNAQSRAEIRHDRQALHEERQDVRDARRELRDDRRDRRRHVAYVSPYRGWKYRPVTVGYQLRPAFYGTRYYISDFGRYNLRAPGRWQRWIRYGDDLLLVNVRTGRVIQVIRNRYW
ncbi:MAG TPA: RcnB family protein [Allosphingosinicella sp.]|nr:RcnB family protein [Allosphingosinicella sp.]